MAPKAAPKAKAVDWKVAELEKAKAKRAAAAAKKEICKKEHLDLLKKYDKSADGKLQKEELIQLLTESVCSTAAGVKPTDEEVEWLLRVADKPKRGELPDGCIDLSEIDDAIACFGTLNDVREELESKLEKYICENTDSGKVKKDVFPVRRLHDYLTDLNGGADVNQLEQAKVLKWLPKEWQDDVKQENIAVKELLPATALWYSENNPQGTSQCCAVQ